MDNFLHHLPRDYSEVNQPVVPQIFLLVILEYGGVFALLQSSGMPLSHHDHPKIIESAS